MTTQIGLGWFLRDDLNIGKIVGHGGSTYYHNSMLSVLPKHKLGVVILTNSSEKGDLISEVTDTALKLAVTIKTGQEHAEDIVKPDVATRALTPKEQEKFVGQYAASMGYINVIKKGDTLVTEIDGTTLEIVAREDGHYNLSYNFLGFIPMAMEELKNASLSMETISGHALVLINVDDESYIFGEKINPVPISAAWKNRLGGYEIINLAKGEGIHPEKNALRELDGLLMLEYSFPEFAENQILIPIQPISDTEAIILGMGRGMRETLRIINVEGKEQVISSGYIFQKK